MYVCVCVCICVGLCLCTCKYTGQKLEIFIQKKIKMYVCVHVCVYDMYVYLCLGVYMYKCLYVLCVCVHMCLCVYLCGMYVCVGRVCIHVCCICICLWCVCVHVSKCVYICVCTYLSVWGVCVPVYVWYVCVCIYLCPCVHRGQKKSSSVLFSHTLPYSFDIGSLTKAGVRQGSGTVLFLPVHSWVLIWCWEFKLRPSCFYRVWFFPVSGLSQWAISLFHCKVDQN